MNDRQRALATLRGGALRAGRRVLVEPADAALMWLAADPEAAQRGWRRGAHARGDIAIDPPERGSDGLDEPPPLPPPPRISIAPDPNLSVVEQVARQGERLGAVRPAIAIAAHDVQRAPAAGAGAR